MPASSADTYLIWSGGSPVDLDNPCTAASHGLYTWELLSEFHAACLALVCQPDYPLRCRMKPSGDKHAAHSTGKAYTSRYSLMSRLKGDVLQSIAAA